MLIDLDTGNEIKKVPYAKDYELIVSRLSTEELHDVKAELNRLIEGREVNTAGWLPGSDWSGTPFTPIFEKAALRNFELSGKFFGLITWVVFMERSERWASGKYEKNGVPIPSRTYFRVD